MSHNLLAIAFMVSLVLVASSHGKPDKGGTIEFHVDFSPMRKNADALETKIKLTAKTTQSHTFERGVTVHGPIADNTAADVCLALKTLLIAAQWEVKDAGKTKLQVIGKK